jgi:hypothetical protein
MLISQVDEFASRHELSAELCYQNLLIPDTQRCADRRQGFGPPGFAQICLLLYYLRKSASSADSLFKHVLFA